VCVSKHFTWSVAVERRPTAPHCGALPRSSTGSGPGLTLPRMPVGESFGGIIRTAKDSLRIETTQSATVS